MKCCGKKVCSGEGEIGCKMGAEREGKNQVLVAELGFQCRSVVGCSTYPLDFPTVALPRGALSLGQTPFHIPTKMTIPLFKSFT